MPTVVVYFDDPAAMGYPFDDPDYYNSYKELSAVCEQNGLSLQIARGASYLGDMCFQSGWQFEGDLLKEVAHPIQADLIYVKPKWKELVTGPSDKVLNDVQFGKIGRDKLKTYELLQLYMAPTFAIDATNWQSVLPRLHTDRIVLKPRWGEGGDGVVVTLKDKFNGEEFPFNEAYLIQEFVDSSRGIDGLTTTTHDLRILMFNDKPLLSYIRTPKPGSFISNLAKGGSLKIVAVEQLPQSALDLVKNVDLVFHNFRPRFYAIDLMYAGSRPYVCEINTQPGLPTSHPDSYRKIFYDSLVAVFKEALCVE